MVVYTARWLLPVVGPPLGHGSFTVEEGRIRGFEPRGRKRGAAHREVRDLGDAIVLPGLVNAHTHLELSGMAERIPEGLDYVAWVRRLVGEREAEDEAVSREAARRAIETLVSRGTVAVGDVANRAWVVALLAESPLYAAAFLELFGLRADLAEGQLERAAEALDALAGTDTAGRVRTLLTPHAPHTTCVALLRALAGRASAAGAPLSVHVAESLPEVRWLADGTGPFRELFEERAFADPAWTPPRLSPIAYLNRLGVLSPRTLAVHCVHVDHADVALLQARGVTVVTCPRSNERLGVGRAPVPQLLKAGIPVALGTDSLASAPDLDLFAEMAALRRIHPALSPAAVLRMATLNGARALGFEELGSLEPGKLASGLVVVPAPPEADPLEVVLGVPERVLRLDAAPWEAAA